MLDMLHYTALLGNYTLAPVGKVLVFTPVAE